jgi:hypothetical protein
MVVSLALSKRCKMFTHKQLECQLHVWRGLFKDVVNEAWTCQHDITCTSNSTRGLQVTHRHNHTYVNTYHLENTHTVIRRHHVVRKKITGCLTHRLLLSVTFMDIGYNTIRNKRSHGIRPRINYSSGSQEYPDGFQGVPRPLSTESVDTFLWWLP